MMDIRIKIANGITMKRQTRTISVVQENINDEITQTGDESYDTQYVWIPNLVRTETAQKISMETCTGTLYQTLGRREPVS